MTGCRGILSVDTKSLRDLLRRSTKNCDMQFANSDIFKENYSIDVYCTYLSTVDIVTSVTRPTLDRTLNMKSHGKHPRCVNNNGRNGSFFNVATSLDTSA